MIFFTGLNFEVSCDTLNPNVSGNPMVHYNELKLQTFLNLPG